MLDFILTSQRKSSLWTGEGGFVSLSNSFQNTLLFYTFRDSETRDNRISKLNLIPVFESRNKQKIRSSKLDLTVCSSFKVSIKGKCRCTATAAATSSRAERQTHRSLAKVSDEHAALPCRSYKTRHLPLRYIHSVRSPAFVHESNKMLRLHKSPPPSMQASGWPRRLLPPLYIYCCTGHEVPPAQTTYSTNSVGAELTLQLIHSRYWKANLGDSNF